MNIVEIYCDGGCRGNGQQCNVGGWGVLLRYKGCEKTFKGAVKDTTNNIMELTACIQALQKIKRKNIPVILTTDSKYICDGVNSWSVTWKKNGWKNSKRKEVENKTLWIQLLGLVESFNNINIVHCRGHADNEGNIIADALANEAMDNFYKESLTGDKARL